MNALSLHMNEKNIFLKIIISPCNINSFNTSEFVTKKGRCTALMRISGEIKSLSKEPLAF